MKPLIFQFFLHRICGAKRRSVRCALINALVSPTKRSIILFQKFFGYLGVIQYFVQYLLRKTSLGHFCSKFSQVSKVFLFRIFKNLFTNPHSYSVGYVFFTGSRKSAPRKRNLGFNFNHNPFHINQFIISLNKDRKLCF